MREMTAGIAEHNTKALVHHLSVYQIDHLDILFPMQLMDLGKVLRKKKLLVQISLG